MITGAWISVDFLFGLYVYIRLTQLSIDRAGNNAQRELNEYFELENIPLPAIVLSAIKARIQQIRPTPWRQLVLWVAKLIGRKSKILWLSKSDLTRIQTAISQLSEFVDLSSKEEKNEVRLVLAQAEYSLMKLLPRRVSQAGINIEHLHHTKNSKLKKFYNLVINTWPNTK